jgi:hypothetical protein
LADYGDIDQADAHSSGGAFFADLSNIVLVPAIKIGSRYSDSKEYFLYKTGH